MALTFKSVSEPRQRVYRAYLHLWGYLGCWKGLSRFYGAHLGRVDTGILILCGAVFFWLLRQLTALTAEKIHSEKRLQESESELRKLNDLKNTFLGIAAHDLRNSSFRRRSKTSRNGLFSDSPPGFAIDLASR